MQQLDNEAEPNKQPEQESEKEIEQESEQEAEPEAEPVAEPGAAQENKQNVEQEAELVKNLQKENCTPRAKLGRPRKGNKKKSCVKRGRPKKKHPQISEKSDGIQTIVQEILKNQRMLSDVIENKMRKHEEKIDRLVHRVGEMENMKMAIGEIKTICEGFTHTQTSNFQMMRDYILRPQNQIPNTYFHQYPPQPASFASFRSSPCYSQPSQQPYRSQDSRSSQNSQTSQGGSLGPKSYSISPELAKILQLKPEISAVASFFSDIILDYCYKNALINCQNQLELNRDTNFTQIGLGRTLSKEELIHELIKNKLLKPLN